MKQFCQRPYFILCFCFIMLFFSGCGRTQTAQIEDRDFILAIGITHRNHSYALTFVRANFENDTRKTDVVTYEGETIAEIEKSYLQDREKALDFSHLEAIVLDDAMLTQLQHNREWLSYMELQYPISRNTLLFYTHAKIQTLFALDEKLDNGIGIYFEKLGKTVLRKKGIHPVTIGELITTSYEPNRTILIPELCPKENTISLSGGIFTQAVKRFVRVSEVERKWLNLIDAKEKDAVLVEPVGKGSQHPVYRIKSMRKKMVLSLRDNHPYLLLQLNGIVQRLQPGTSCQQFSDYFQKMAVRIFHEFISEKQLDFLNLNQKTIYLDRATWNRYQNHQKQFLKDLSFGIVVKLQEG